MVLQDLVDELSKSMNDTLGKLIKFYHKIIEFLVMVFEGFESVMGTVRNNLWRDHDKITNIVFDL